MRNQKKSGRGHRIGVALGAASLAIAGPLGAQGTCSNGMPAFGSLGVGTYQCVGGSCAINMRTGDPYAHSFSTEPRLRDIDRDGPAAELIRDGDILVAIDGSLITSAEGGRKLGSLKPGQDVELTLRRRGRQISAWLRTENSCELPRLEVTTGTGLTGNALSYGYVVADSLTMTWPTPPDSVWRHGIIADSMWARTDSAFRQGVLPWSRPFYTLSDSSGLSYGIATGPQWRLTLEDGALRTGLPVPGLFPATRPRVEFGLELTCGDCGWRGSGRGLAFDTDVFPMIQSVEKDGPADRAGLLAGDMLLTVAGAAITSDEAGRALGALAPGDTVLIEVRRGDRILEISMTPREATARRQRM